MFDPFDLERFVLAQDQVMQQVRRELSEGRKASHWMWFVFPQLAGLGHSSMARHYAIASLDEARAYLQHPVLGSRLIECSELVNRVEGRSINQIFGAPDDLKFHSCMTLFCLVQGPATVFKAVLAKHFGGMVDRQTTERLAIKGVKL